MKITSFDDCYRELVAKTTKHGRVEYERWRRRPGYAQVVDFVSGFNHCYLYQISTVDVQEAIDASEHALGNVQAGEQLKLVENFSTPFAFQHLFHWYIESKKRVPTWKDFRDWMVEGAAAPCWYHPLKQYLEERGLEYNREQWSRAAKWRLGKVYMSNIRELHLLACLREAGLPVNYHLLADVLLRVDFWCENVLVCVYFPNPEFRSGKKGRKPPASNFFDTATGSHEIIDFKITRQGFGNIWLADTKSVESLITLLASKVG